MVELQRLSVSHILQIVECVDVAVEADQECISQMLTNLNFNAIKYSP